MVPFKGKSYLRQYLPSKPRKWGFKLWGRAGVSGFLYDFDVYSGKSNENTKSVYGLSGEVVLQMASTLPKHHNFKLFADNFFTSLPLIETLKHNGILFVGTARTGRLKNCPLMCEKDLKKTGRGV